MDAGEVGGVERPGFGGRSGSWRFGRRERNQRCWRRVGCSNGCRRARICRPGARSYRNGSNWPLRRYRRLVAERSQGEATSQILERVRLAAGEGSRICSVMTN